jgi:hypothetical protein
MLCKAAGEAAHHLGLLRQPFDTILGKPLGHVTGCAAQLK